MTTKRTDARILRDLQNVESGLSPENLTCDGECSPAEVRSRRAALLRKQKELIKELGRTPSDRELYGKCGGCGEYWPCSVELNRGMYSGVEHAKHSPK